MFEMGVTSPAEVGRTQLDSEFAVPVSLPEDWGCIGLTSTGMVCWDTPECRMIITGVGQTEKEKL